VEDLLPKIPALVADCISSIAIDILPYFERVAELRMRG